MIIQVITAVNVRDDHWTCPPRMKLHIKSYSIWTLDSNEPECTQENIEQFKMFVSSNLEDICKINNFFLTLTCVLAICKHRWSF